MEGREKVNDGNRCSCCGLGLCLKSSRISQSSVSQAKMEREGEQTIPIIVPTIAGIDEAEIKINEPSPSTREESFIAPPRPATKSLLGGDLLLQAMPPQTTTTVKKARNLVQPGMSMVRWMKLQENKQRPPTRRKIPLSEIQKHDKDSDCWMVIRNCVYDVTEYMPYHPGGIPELMKGAGKDATALFNEVHRWVNFDSILRSCLQGYLLVEPAESFDEAEEEDSDSIMTKSIVPKTSFSENDSLLFYQVDTLAESEMSEDNWCVSLINRERFLLKVIIKPPDLWMAHIKLLETIKDDKLTVNFQNSFRKVVITFQKPRQVKWNSLGTPLNGNNQLMDSRNVFVDDFCRATVVEKENLTHDVILIGVKPVATTFLHVPVGFHLKIRLPNDIDLSRKYTPVKKSLLDPDSDNNLLYFIIKVYPNGKLTKSLGLLQIDSALEIGCVAGRYDHSFLCDCDTLALIAGGSGITPFIKILDFIRRRPASYPISRIALMYFNHTDEDIIWKEQFTNLATSWEPFHFVPVITTSVKDWSGRVGRVNDISLFESILQQTISTSSSSKSDDKQVLRKQLGRFKAMICGSSGFNDACVTMLKNQSVVDVVVAEEDVFLF